MADTPANKMQIGDKVRFKDSQGEHVTAVIKEFVPRVFGGEGCNLLTDKGVVVWPNFEWMGHHG